MKSRISKAQNLNDFIKLGWLIFFRDFQYRYRLSFFGYIWAFMRPFLVGLPIIVVGKQFNFAEGMLPNLRYEIYAFTGLMFFQIFWSAVEHPQIIMWRTRKILKQVVIPYEVIIIASLYYIAIDLFVYSVLTIVAIILFKVSLQPLALLTIFSIPLLILSGLSLGILFAPISLIYLDLRYGITILSGILLWSTPVLYIMPNKGLINIVNKFNPLTYLINLPRFCLISGVESNKWLFFVSFSIFFVVFFIGFQFYRRAISLAIDAIP